MDDNETHDDRRLLVGTGFTIEPGVYFDDFGVRSEINMIVGPRDAVVTGPVQAEILALV
jgi:Xaa-Pro aminopeptidase